MDDSLITFIRIAKENVKQIGTRLGIFHTSCKLHDCKALAANMWCDLVWIPLPCECYSWLHGWREIVRRNGRRGQCGQWSRRQTGRIDVADHNL